MRRASASRSAGAALPTLLFFTDPKRTPDPVAVAERLPPGSGIVFRAFGAVDGVETGRRLAAVARRRGLTLLVGADPALACAIGADGLHLPERLVRQAPRLRRLGWIVTGAAHSLGAARAAARAGLDAVVISPVFPSRSPSAATPLGALKFSALVRQAGLPAYALGGITPQTARAILRSGAIGLAAVEALAS
ncbi:MAG: thiamine monophosphate synthase [Caulobacterales bacterium 68-7]|nr:thiamine phosphate synthase [Caulobacterales bacterium]OJU10987.1 MAG: thiamine monophosphate synthase [Caulobacterales bacterium 68-7]